METLEHGDPRQVGAYALIGRLGSADTGEVYAGRTTAGQDVAVTVVRPEVAAATGFRERFRAGLGAARAVSGQSSSCIMPVVDADPDAPSPWSATSVVRGLPLRQAVAHGGLPETALRRLATRLGGALARIHAAGLVHGNLGPDSVVLASDGPYIPVMILAVGSPEQDMFDLGTTVLFAASGAEPRWEGLGELATVIATLPPSLCDVIGGCLYPDSSTRPTAEQFVNYLNGQGLPFPTGDWLPAALTAEIKALTPKRADGGVSRRNLVLGLAGGALLVAGGATAAVLSSGGSQSRQADTKHGSTKPTSGSSASASATSSNGPTPITLDAPAATKVWTLAGQSAITCLEASDTVLMALTANATFFFDASTGGRAFSALNTTNSDGSDEMTSPTTYSGGVFYYLCETSESFNVVAAVDATTGNIKWATDMAEQDSSGNDFYTARYVAVNENTVFVCGGVDNTSNSSIDVTTGYISAFDGSTGKGLWTVQGTDINNVLVPQSGSYLLAATSSPATKNGQVEMIDASKQGARGWKISTSNEEEYFTTGWPLMCYAAGVFFFVGGAGNVVIAADAATGHEKWRQTFDAINGDQVELGYIFTSLDGGTVFVPMGGNLIALNTADGTAKWAAALTGTADDGTDNLFNAGLGGSAGRAALSSSDTVFLTDSAKNLWAIDAATGKARWKYNDPGQPDTGFKWTVGGDHVFIASNLTLTAISAH